VEEIKMILITGKEGKGEAGRFRETYPLQQKWNA